DIGEHIIVMSDDAAAFELLEPTLRPDLCGGGDEKLRIGIGCNHGAGVAAVEDGSSWLAGELLLTLEQRGADRGISRDHRRYLGHGLAAQLGVLGIEPLLMAGTQCLELVARVAAPSPQAQRDRAI